MVVSSWVYLIPVLRLRKLLAELLAVGVREREFFEFGEFNFFSFLRLHAMKITRYKTTKRIRQAVDPAPAPLLFSNLTFCGMYIDL